jgi:hypothetical protein
MHLVDTFSASLIVFEGIFVIWLMTDKKHLTAFAARKLCHAGSGCVLMLLNCNYICSRWFVYALSIGSLIMNWEVFPSLLPNFWFGTARDKGITIYLVLVSLWVYLGWSLRILAPVFFADPAGAVVGKWMTHHFPKDNKKWIGDKTFIGSFAVFLVTFISLYRPVATLPRVVVSILATLAEAVGGSFDNLMIALVVVAASGILV